MKNKTSARLAAVVAVAFVAMTLAPATSALNLSRTFPDLPPSLEFIAKPVNGTSPGGAGWHDINTPGNSCVGTLLGLRIGVPNIVYYQYLRIASNINKHLLTTPAAFVALSCPIPPAMPNSPGCANGTLIPPYPDATANPFCNVVGSGPFNIWLAATVSQSALLCVDPATFASACFSNLDASWTMYKCDPSDIVFVPGDIVGLGPPAVGSSAADCDGTDHYVHDYTSFLDPTDFFLSTGFEVPHIDTIVHSGQGNHYVISCYTPGTTTEVTGLGVVIVHSKAISSSHDWFFVLDQGYGTPANVTAAQIINHLTGLQGLYDLSGDNGCLIDDAGSPNGLWFFDEGYCPPEDKPKSYYKDTVKDCGPSGGDFTRN